MYAGNPRLKMKTETNNSDEEEEYKIQGRSNTVKKAQRRI